MKTTKYKTREDWLAGRVGKVTGIVLKEIVVKRGTGKKIGFYKLIAARLGIPEETGELPMIRGSRLEEDVVKLFEAEYDKKVDTSLVIWQRDDDDSIAISPDGFIETKEAVEVKCLGSANHIKALIENEVPDDYEFQKLQYFIVNDELETLYFCFFDPRVEAKPFFCIEVHRKDVQEDVDTYLEYQRKELAEVREIVNKLTF